MDYKSKELMELYNFFMNAFEQEGDVYESLKDSIEDESQEHALIPKTIQTKMIMTILNDAAIAFYSKEMVVLSEEEYLNSIK